TIRTAIPDSPNFANDRRSATTRSICTGRALGTVRTLITFEAPFPVTAICAIVVLTALEESGFDHPAATACHGSLPFHPSGWSPAARINLERAALNNRHDRHASITGPTSVYEPNTMLFARTGQSSLVRSTQEAGFIDWINKNIIWSSDNRLASVED